MPLSGKPDPLTPPPRRRGRPPSVAARSAVLVTAAELLDERGFAGFTIDEVARRSGVSKSTIYKHWTGALDVAADAYGDIVTNAVPVMVSGDVVGDLFDQIRRLARFYASPRGKVVAQLLAAGTGHERGAAVLREKFFGKRRAETAALIERGKANGELRADVDPELAIDLLFGPIVFRLFNGVEPFGDAAAAEIARMGLSCLVTDLGSAFPESPGSAPAD